MNSTGVIPALFIGACLLSEFTHSSATAADLDWISVTPIGYRVGRVPYPFGGAFTSYPSTPGSISDITDSSLATFTHIQGLDGFLQPNGYRVDGGTFFLLEYQIDPAAEQFSINFSAGNDGSLSPAFRFAEVYGVLLSNGSVHPSHEVTTLSRDPTSFDVWFSRTANTGNQDGRFGLNSIMNSQGRLQIALQAGYLAAIDEPGAMNAFLYEVTASYSTVVPEPSPVALFLAAAPIIFLIAYARNRAASK